MGFAVIGVVADDITGSNDIGIMFAKSDYLTHVFSYDLDNGFKPLGDPQPEVLILDTDSRLDQAGDAYQKVFRATKDIRKAGATQFFNKTCSVFRGNIGAEFDAMLDALEEEFAVIVLGFPKNGRTTVNGIHYVHGKKLQDSEFRDDPVHPMTRSDLVGILQSQTKRKVGLIDHTVVHEGMNAVKARLAEMKKAYQYVILDVTSQEDLTIIAEAVKDVRVICGSSALAEELPAVWEKKDKTAGAATLAPYGGKGILCAAGSLMPQTARQVHYMRERGAAVVEFDTIDFVGAEHPEYLTDHFADSVVEILNNGRDVVFHTSNAPEKVKKTKEIAARKGLSNTEISHLVSEAVAKIVHAVISRTGQNRLIVAGGNTSAAVCRRMGITGMRICEEIAPGLPSCVSLSEPPLGLVLKSGSFGTENFFEKAFAHLKAL